MICVSPLSIREPLLDITAVPRFWYLISWYIMFWVDLIWQKYEFFNMHSMEGFWVSVDKYWWFATHIDCLYQTWNSSWGHAPAWCQHDQTPNLPQMYCAEITLHYLLYEVCWITLCAAHSAVGEGKVQGINHASTVLPRPAGSYLEQEVPI